MPPNELTFCIIRLQGGPVTITLRANNALRAGSTFTAWGPDGETELETWGMAAGDQGEASHDVGEPAASLDGAFLTWEVDVCSPLPAVETGAVEIVVSQDGVSCATTKPLRWDLEEIPQCDSEEVTAIRRGLRFRGA